jgi:tripartite-type tricarboxylate transporter receptor subunit TctC
MADGRRRTLLALAGASLAPAAGGSRTARAQDWPSRPVRFIVPFPPGGANDVLARLLGVQLSTALGQQVVIDNRGGANTIIGCDLTAKATPDGYTILIVPGSHAINPSLYRALPYDTVKDFAAVSLVGNGAYVLLANPSLPARSIEELLALARAKPGTLSYASAGIGNITHLAGELFASMGGVRFTHVPYKGGGQALADLVGGHVSLYFATVAAAGPHLKSGKLRALAVTTTKRTAALPTVPTMAEAGLPGYEVSGWYGVLAPARTPRPVVDRLSRAISKAVQVPEVRDTLVNVLGIDPVGSEPALLDARIREEIPRWGKLVRSLGIQPE